jgi:hypothetical protein
VHLRSDNLIDGRDSVEIAVRFGNESNGARDIVEGMFFHDQLLEDTECRAIESREDVRCVRRKRDSFSMIRLIASRKYHKAGDPKT